MNVLLKFACIAGAAVVAACASPSAAPVLLTLPAGTVAAAPTVVTSSSATATAPAAPASAPLLAVRRVGIPEYLVARRVRYRADAATLAEWPNTYWAERIEIGVSRSFVSALRQQLPGWAICDTNCGELVPTLNLQVDLAPLDYQRSAQQLQARARITVSGHGAPAPESQTIEFGADTRADTDTAQGHAQAIAALLQKLAAEAAALVRNVRP
jgi:uncharacterized lipoprotein YmbA